MTAVLIPAVYVVFSNYAGVGISPCCTKTPATTIINGVEYYIGPVTSGTNLSKGVVLKEVEFVRLPITTTGCLGDWFLVLFPDGATEVLQIYYACTGTPAKKSLVVSKHSCPKVGLQYRDGKLYFLVSRGCVRAAKKIITRQSGSWLIRLIVPENATLKNPKILYELVYVGEPFLAASVLMPTTSCSILVQKPGGREAIIYDREICPWIRENASYILPGYTYKHWIDLSEIAMKPGTYNITLQVNCIIHKISYRTEKVESLEINTSVSVVFELS